MTLILACMLILLVLAVAVWLGKKRLRPEDVHVAAHSCGTCRGGHAKCEQDCMLEAATQPVEYYDDEELDTFRGRSSDNYTDSETEQFREVLYTMRPDEVAGWNRSLALRGINVPDQLKDELVMLIGG